MRRVVLESVRLYARRYVAAGLAIVLGVGFVVVINALTSSARSGILAGFEQEYAGADVMVTAVGPDVAERVVSVAEDEGGAASINAVTFQPVSVDGVRIAEGVPIGTVSAVPQLRWQQLVDGRFPNGPGELVVDADAAETNRVAVGDALVVGTDQASVTARVVGTVDGSPGSLDATAYLTWADLQPFRDALILHDVVYDTGPLDQGAAIARIDNALPEAVVLPRDDYLEQLQTEANQGVNVLAIVVLLFAGIAFFVSALVITNTFTILLAQRQRDFALLRCVGATRKQVLRSVRLEALALGAAASALGVLAGTALGYAAVAAIRGASDSVPLGAIDLSWSWIGGGWLLGVLVTLGASMLPARRATRVSPLAALRPDFAVPVRSRAGAGRLVLAGLALAAGVVLMLRAMDQHELVVMMAGGGSFFVGVLLLGPVLVPALIRIGSAAAAPLVGVPGRLAAASSRRHPRRTAATAASLLVGVTLISAIVVGMASVRTTVEAEMDAQHPLDGALVSASALDPGTVQQVAATPGVAGRVLLQGLDATVSGGVGDIPVVGVPNTSEVVRGEADFLGIGPGMIFVPVGLADLTSGESVRVRTDSGELRLEVRLGEGWGHSALVSPATLARLGDPEPRALWVRASEDVDGEELIGDLTAVARSAGARFEGGLDDRAYVELQLDVLMGAAIGLLGVSVLVALGGIGNTLGLSVLERTRELALLRAMGLTRRGLRATLAAEALLLALVAGVVGVATGTLFAWVGVETVVGKITAEPALVVPVGQLLAVVAVVGVAGLLACVVPARRGARIVPAAGLTAE